MRTLRKAAVAVIMMLMVACGVYAESYAGFEVKEGSGGTKVIIIKLSEDYSDPSEGKYDVVFPLAYYKILEKEIKEYDKFINMSDQNIRDMDKTILTEKDIRLEKIYGLNEEYLGNDSEEIYNWHNIEEESESNIYYDFWDLIDYLEKATDSLYKYLFTIRNGYDSSDLSIPRKSLIPLLELKETFPSAEFKKLDIKW
ncbi:MAG: hypothetical protein J5647_03825 [Spirochaetaceae bacterium]|nr:hypothetical protein [Spirochaetaceae bacterium]